MPASHLKLYCGPHESHAELLGDETDRENSVTMPLGEILPLLADAVNSKRTWLSDFDDDEVTISADLYEVLSAYQYFRRPSA